ncbi:FkbM family methyltransferase [bacterium]|nr:MAG: FkbM family methyltransferase [bacterium]
MIVRHFDVKVPVIKPPQGDGWEQAWFGYHWMTKCVSQEGRADCKERDRAAKAEGQMTETEFQRDCFLSVLADIQRKNVNMFELGAGWGRMCLSLAGVIDHKIIPIIPVSYSCLAVEGEPAHYQWAKEHFNTHKICGTVVQGGVSDRNGRCQFCAHPEANSCYGQAIESSLSFNLISTIRSLRGFIARKGIKVPMYTVDRLIESYGFDHVDLIQMDVQGAEYKVILGASKSIKNNLIDYLLISVHDRKLNAALKKLLSPKFNLIIDTYRISVGKVEGFPPINLHDGIQLYKRKDI